MYDDHDDDDDDDDDIYGAARDWIKNMQHDYSSATCR